jgi:ketosteroid isomerase-like protein
MKLILPMTVLALAASSAAFGVQSAADSNGGAEQTIKQLEQDWAVALKNRDTAATDQIVAPSWMMTDQDGVLSDKAQADADLKTGAYLIETFKIDDLQVHVDGDTAVVFGVETEKSTYKGTDSSGQYRFTDVFVKRDGSWKAIATHVSKVTKH